MFSFFSKNSSKKASNVALIQQKTFNDCSRQRNFLEQLNKQSLLPSELISTHIEPICSVLVAWIHNLPASETHHHSYEFGLIEHSFECALFADQLSNDIVLSSLEQSIDLKSQRESNLRLAVIVLALLHDVGKAIYDIQVTSGKDVWNPLKEPLEAFSNRHQYTVIHWQPQRVHKRHEVFNLLLLKKLLPEQFTDLLLNEGLFISFIEALAGCSTTSTLSQVLCRADCMSTGESVKTEIAKSEEQKSVLNNKQPDSNRQIRTKVDPCQSAKEAIAELKQQMLQKSGSFLASAVQEKDNGVFVTSAQALNKIESLKPGCFRPIMVGLLMNYQTKPSLRLKEDELFLYGDNCNEND